MTGPVIIVDWGTSSFRAWLVDAPTGEIQDSITSRRGMATLTPPEFPAYFQASLGRWRGEKIPTPTYMAGMVGAAQGWNPAPQPPLPVTLDDLARQIMPAPGMENAWIIPGTRTAEDPPDVMRGEEVQVFGAMALSGRRNGFLCLPGTHSKWVRVSDGALTGFTTSMTGEVYALMLAHSILRLGLENGADTGAEDNQRAFQYGCEQSGRPGGLLSHMFTARTLTLYGDLAPACVPSYLSGLLIGTEVLAMAGAYPATGGELLLVGEAALRDPYEYALGRAGYEYRWVEGRQATLGGVRELIRRHGQMIEAGGYVQAPQI